MNHWTLIKFTKLQRMKIPAQSLAGLNNINTANWSNYILQPVLPFGIKVTSGINLSENFQHKWGRFILHQSLTFIRSLPAV